MRLRALIGVFAVVAVLAAGAAPRAQEDRADAGDEPRRTELLEQTESRLVQLDISVSGPRSAIQDLTAEDFELVVGGDPIPELTVDNLCRLPEEDPVRVVEGTMPAEPFPGTPQAESSAVPAPRASYLFYFDQNHLNLGGRVRSSGMAKDMIRELIVDGHRGMIVSNGRDLRTFAELTDDPEELVAAIDRMIADEQHWWDPTADTEESRIVEILEMLAEDATSALTRARLYAAEESWRTEKTLRLFSLTLGRLTDLDPPRAVIYFADRMRSNGGEHYLSYFSSMETQKLRGLTANHAFQQLLEEANAMGIRFYTVQAEGLADESNPLRMTNRAVASSGTFASAGNTQRIKDAQSSLVGMALESGGKHFLNGVRTKRIIAEIREDLSCLYLLSFRPENLLEDSPLPVLLRTLRPKVKARVRGRVVVQSESKRLTTRLLAAFAAPEGVESGFPLSGFVIPTGFEDGRYSALVQMLVPGSPMAATSWDMGLSLVSRGEVREDASGKISVTSPGTPVIFEAEMHFRPGPFEVVSVAHETRSDEISTIRIEGAWPDPNEEPATVGPIVVLQPDHGVFLRADAARTSGPVGLGDRDSARADRPTALVGLVCRAKSNKKKLTVERQLVGESSVDFPTEGFQADDGRCVVFSDLVRAGTMTAGSFRYEVRVLRGDEELASGERKFVVRPESVDSAQRGPSGPR